MKAPRLALVSGALAAAIVLTIAGCSSEEEPLVETGEVSTATVVEVVEAPASVVAAASASVSSPATGTVRSLRVSDGQRVARGDVLLVIDSPDAERALAQAQQAAATMPAALDLSGVDASASNTQATNTANRAFNQAERAARQIPDLQVRKQALQQVASARAQFEAAQAQANATVSQINQGIASLEQALAGLTQSQQAQTQAAVAAAQRAVDALTVTAPIKGQVVIGPSAATSNGDDLSGLVDALPDSLAGEAESLVGGSTSSGGSTTGELRIGSPVSAGDPLLTITDTSALSLRAEVDETDVLLVHKNVKADVEMDAVPGSSYRAVVRNVDLSPTTSSRGGVSYVVRLELLGGTTAEGLPAPRPRPGMSAVASLRVDTAKETIAAPVSAVFRDGDLDAVWIVENGVAEKRNVVVGAQGADYLQITEGLELGDLIVVRGADQVREGEEVP